MNKTVNMNLGGFFFHIDEDAYQKLNRYFEAIKRSLSNEGKDEIMNDIENRISELFSERLISDKQVLSLKDVDDIIAIMGQPEDYKIEENETNNKSYDYIKSSSKKLYRDTENGILGGVCSGLEHYLGIDKIWIRIILILLVVAGVGVGIVVYIILWIIAPEAKTTAEKLEMQGEPINISNIEKKVMAEFNNVSDKLKNADYDKMGRQVKSSAEKIGNTLNNFLPKLFTILGKVIGFFMVFITATTLLVLIMGLFTIGSFSIFNMPGQNFIEASVYSGIPFWLLATLGILLISIPFFFLLVIGLKLLVPHLKSMGNTVKYTLLSLWVISIICLIIFGSKQAIEYNYEGKVSEKRELFIMKNDTLKVRFKYNDLYDKNFDSNDDFRFVQDESKREMIYSNNVELEIMPTPDDNAYILIERLARGNSISNASNRASKIKYNFEIKGNEIILDNYLLTETNNKYRSQEIKIYLYLPEGTLLAPDKSVKNYDDSDNTYFNLHYSGEYTYKVTKNKVICLNCPDDENEDNEDNENKDNNNAKSTSLTIDDDGIKIERKDKSDTIVTNNKKIKELKIDKNGIIIKTN